MIVTTKQCVRCNTGKDITEFSRDKYRPDGRCSYCKSCVRTYQQANNDAIYEQKKQYRRSDVGKAVTNRSKRAYMATAKGKAAQRRSNHKRRARSMCAVPQRWRKSECPDTTCYWCGVDINPIDSHIDHIMPISKGGPQGVSNEVYSCKKCNLSKGIKHPLVWIAEQF